jgi:GTPase SAR1 family protein
MATMPDGGTALAQALGALSTERDREQLAALRDRLAEAGLRVLVVGEAKRGKATLVNALLGRTVLPSGVTPLTVVTARVRYGGDERTEVRFPALTVAAESALSSLATRRTAVDDYAAHAYQTYAASITRVTHRSQSAGAS